VKEFLEALNELEKYNIVTLCWIPGYIVIPRNESPDVLAKSGAYKCIMDLETFCEVGNNAIILKTHQMFVDCAIQCFPIELSVFFKIKGWDLDELF